MLAAKVGLTNISEIHLWRTCNWDGSIHFAANRSHLFRFGNPSSPSEMPHCKPAPSNKRKDGDASERGGVAHMKLRSPTTITESQTNSISTAPTIAPTSPAFWSGPYQPMGIFTLRGVKNLRWSEQRRAGWGRLVCRLLCGNVGRLFR